MAYVVPDLKAAIGFFKEKLGVASFLVKEDVKIQDQIYLGKPDAAAADMKARGFDLVQSGRNGDTRFAYFDTDGLIGTLTELVYLAPAERAGFERMKRKEI